MRQLCRALLMLSGTISLHPQCSNLSRTGRQAGQGPVCLPVSASGSLRPCSSIVRIFPWRSAPEYRRYPAGSVTTRRGIKHWRKVCGPDTRPRRAHSASGRRPSEASAGASVISHAVVPFAAPCLDPPRSRASLTLAALTCRTNHFFIKKSGLDVFPGVALKAGRTYVSRAPEPGGLPAQRRTK